MEPATVHSYPAFILELIPEHTRKTIANVTYDGVMKYKRYLEKHPEEKRRFEERVAEIDRKLKARKRHK